MTLRKALPPPATRWGPETPRPCSTTSWRPPVAEPTGVLRQIAAAKREEIKSRFADVSLDALRARAMPTRLSLAATLSLPAARFVLEIKKASPSGGSIQANADPARLARGYAGVADALSVLCDAQFFGGS